MTKKKVAVLFADGFEEIEALSVVDYLRRADITVDMISINNQLEVVGAHTIKLTCDMQLSELNSDYDAVVLPGGLPGAEHLRDSEEVISFVQKMNTENKIVAAICAAPIVLERAGLTKGKIGTSYPGFENQLTYDEYKEDIVVQDGNLITARGPATAVYFALKLIEVLLNKSKALEIAKDLLLDLVEDQVCDLS